jgi:hypothetical protein
MTDTRTESRDLAHHRPAAAPAPAQDGSADRFAQTIQMVREAMLNPEVDAEKAKAMADLMISLEDRSLQAEFNRAKNAAVQEMPVITKDGRIVIKKQGEPERQQGRFARAGPRTPLRRWEARPAMASATPIVRASIS